MSDGLPTPAAHDGMGVVTQRRIGVGNEIILVRNDELSNSSTASRVIGADREHVAKYDTGTTGVNYQIGGNTYRPSCSCSCVPGIVAAPAPARLIERGKFGDLGVGQRAAGQVPVWLPEPAAACRNWPIMGCPCRRAHWPAVCARCHRCSRRCTRRWRDKLRSEPHWHADETRWEVFVELRARSDIAGTCGCSSRARWCTTCWTSRARPMWSKPNWPASSSGFISCDRYGAYKKFARLHPGIALAFCWAHQRRDFLMLANDYPAAVALGDGLGRCRSPSCTGCIGLRAQAPRSAAPSAPRTTPNCAGRGTHGQQQRDRSVADLRLPSPPPRCCSA